jgi:hypothetical protein
MVLEGGVKDIHRYFMYFCTAEHTTRHARLKMKASNLFLIVLLSISSQMVTAQRYEVFLDAYHFNKNFESPAIKNPNAYDDVQGNPYLNREFNQGVIFLKDTTAVRLPLRYNIYTDKMEYLLNGITYEIGNPRFVKRIELDSSVFLYLPSVRKGGYFELLETGKCTLVQKRLVGYEPAEGPKPIQGTITPARFSRDSDVFYLVTPDSVSVEITNMKSLMTALQDQKPKLEAFAKTEGIRSAKKDNLVKLVEYYNSL